MKPVVLAFLQNTWARDADRVRAMFRKHEGDRHLLCARLLFSSNCLTARRLREHIRREHLDRIIWEEASREITDQWHAAPGADICHMGEVIDKFKPDVIIALGKIPQFGVLSLRMMMKLKCEVINVRHPASRHKSTGLSLDVVGKRLNEIWPDNEKLHETFSV